MKKPAAKPPTAPARKAAPARKPKVGLQSKTEADAATRYSGGRLGRSDIESVMENKYVERFAFLADDRLALAALARRFYPDLAPDAARVKLHGHLSATAAARSLTGEEEAKLLALVEDFALFLMHKCQPKKWEPAAGNIRSVDLIWADNGQRSVIAVDKPDGTGRFRLFIPITQPIDGSAAHMITRHPPEYYMEPKEGIRIPPPAPFKIELEEAPTRPRLDPTDFGRR